MRFPWSAPPSQPPPPPQMIDSNVAAIAAAVISVVLAFVMAILTARKKEKKGKEQAAERAAQLERLATLPEHLQLGVTLPGMRELLLELPDDALEQVNAQIPLDKETSEPKFPTNDTFNGYANQFFMKLWAKEPKEGQPEGDGLAVCERLQNQKSPHVGEATVFVSWFLDMKISTLLDALAHTSSSRRGCGRRRRSSGCATT